MTANGNDTAAKKLLQTAFADMPKEIRDAFFHGTKRRLTFRQGSYKYESDWKGALRECATGWKIRHRKRRGRRWKSWLHGPLSGLRRAEVCSRKVLPLRSPVSAFGEYTELPISDSVGKFEAINLTPREEKIAGLVLKEIRDRLGFLDAVGLGYLTLNRSSATLSGGEGQRIRLATQIGSQLRGVLYVLDEPSIGLHPRDNKRLLDTLHELRDLGNTVLVVEHDEETIENADYVVDLGPLAGTHGGEVIATGDPKKIKTTENSLTGRYLSGNLKIDVPDCVACRTETESRSSAHAGIISRISMSTFRWDCSFRNRRVRLRQIDAGRRHSCTRRCIGTFINQPLSRSNTIDRGTRACR